MKWTLLIIYIQEFIEMFPQATLGSGNYYGKFKAEEISTEKIRNSSSSIDSKPELRLHIEPKPRFGVVFLFCFVFFLPNSFPTQKERRSLRNSPCLLNLTDPFPGAKGLPSQGVCLSWRKETRMSLHSSQQCYQGSESPWSCFSSCSLA